MTLKQDIAARANVILSEENDALIEENKRLKDIISRAVPSIEFHWSIQTAGGPRKSKLLALRREAEEVAATLEQAAL